jgi:hypothetical protein
MSIDVFPASVLNATLWNGYSMPLLVTGGGTGATDASTARTNLGLGTLAQQNATAVAITGGSATGLTSLSASNYYMPNIAGSNAFGFWSDLAAAGGTDRYFLYGVGDAPSYITGCVGFNLFAPSNYQCAIGVRKGDRNGLKFRHLDNDTGGAYTVTFHNYAADAIVGSIFTTGTTTTYGTTSDVRLKHAIEKLVGALDVVRQLNPIHFRWNADDSPGEGFLAHELQQHIPAAVTGAPDAVDEAGNMQPQGVDHSKLVPHLVAACQELAAQVQTLTARVATLESQLA